MKRSATIVFSGILWLLTGGGAGTSAAQDKPVLFPAEQFGRAYLVLPQSTMNLENVLGRNANFERLVNYSETDRLRVLARPVGRLDLLVEQDGQTGVATCTASIISSRYILTNHHCSPAGRRNARVRGAQLLMDFYNEAREDDVKKYPVVVSPVESDRALDYAIFEVKGDPAAAFGRVTLSPRDPKPGESLLIIHHPAGLPKHATRGGCRASSPRAVRDNDILHRCDTLPGSSGSPILLSSASAVIGIHYAGSSFAGPGSYNFGKRLSMIARQSPIIAAILREDAETAAREAEARARREAKTRAEREAALRARLETEMQRKMEERLKSVRDAQEALLKSRVERELKLQEEKFRADLATREGALRQQLERDTRARLEREMRAKSAAEQKRLREQMEREMRARLEERLRRDGAAQARELRARLEHELRAQMEEKLRDRSASDRDRLRTELEAELTRQIEDRFKAENASEQAAMRARLQREMQAELQKRMEAEARARQVDLEKQVARRVDAELSRRMAAREKELRARLEKEIRAKLTADAASSGQAVASLSGGTASGSRQAELAKYLSRDVFSGAYRINGITVALPEGAWRRLSTREIIDSRGMKMAREILVQMRNSEPAAFVILSTNSSDMTERRWGLTSRYCRSGRKEEMEYKINKTDRRRDARYTACWKFRKHLWAVPAPTASAGEIAGLNRSRDIVELFIAHAGAPRLYFGFVNRAATPDKILIANYYFSAALHPYARRLGKGKIRGGGAEMEKAGEVLSAALVSGLRGEDVGTAAVRDALKFVQGGP